MNFKIALSIVCCILFLATVKAQNKKIDSLLSVIHTMHDTDKVITFVNISRFYESNDPTTALKFADSCFKYGKKLSDKWMASAYSSKGSCLCTIGKYDESIDLHLSAMRILETTGNARQLANCYNNLANAYMGLGDDEKATEFFFKTYDISKTNSALEDMLAVASFGIGNMLGKKGEYKKAIEKYKLCRSYFKKINNVAYEALALSMMGESFKLDSNLVEAEKCFVMVDAMSRSVNDEYGLALNLINLGDIEIGKKNYKKAAQYYEESYAINLKRKALDNIRGAAQKLSDLYEKQGLYKEALDYHKIYMQYKDSVINTERNKAIAESESKYESEKKEQQLQLQNAEIEKSHLKVTQRNNLLVVFAIASMIFVVLLFFVFRSYKEKKKANDLLTNKNKEIEQKNHLIEEKNKDITDSINYSKHIQRAILPADKYIKFHLKNSFVLFKPKDIVSGDFYLVDEVVGLIYVAVVDCTGHGVPGAMLSVFANSTIKNTIASNSFRDNPAAILSDLCFQFKSNLISDNSSVSINDGVDMAMCVIDKANQKIYFAGARNGLISISKNEVREYKADRWGISGTNTAQQLFFTNHEISYNTGDKFYLTTDGYYDQFGGANGKKLKFKTLLEILKSTSTQSLQEQALNLELEFEKWKGNLEQLDDVTLFGFEV
ncbi:MAG: tetratricopeptide repeat protein [Sphingobacteriaceae bacterium]|nr:tetratricopeptide repeat protein [Sphingobacteriaceae bacterium]